MIARSTKFIVIKHVCISKFIYLHQFRSSYVCISGNKNSCFLGKCSVYVKCCMKLLYIQRLLLSNKLFCDFPPQKNKLWKSPSIEMTFFVLRNYLFRDKVTVEVLKRMKVDSDLIFIKFYFQLEANLFDKSKNKIK